MMLVCPPLKPYEISSVADREDMMMRRSDPLCQALFDSQLTGIALSSIKDDRLAQCNSTWLAMTGYSAEELRHSSLEDLIHPDDKPLFLPWRRAILAGVKDSYQTEVRFLRKNGRNFWTRISMRSVRNNANEISSVLHIIIDINHHKRLKRQFQRAHKIGALGALASGISHDFNNFLMPIIGYAEMLQMEHQENAAFTKPLQEILSAARRASKLAQQILAFSRPGREPKVPVRIDRIVSEAMQLLQALIPTTISVQHEVHHVGNVHASPTQIQQVVMNLCINAYQAMKTNDGNLRVELVKQVITDKENTGLPPGAYAKLRVEDQGEGIPDEILDRVFEPFFTTKEKEAGSGMGLSIVQEIINDCNGHILVDSTVGKGSTFVVYWPLSEIEEDASVKGPIEMDPLPRGTETIMVIDDEIAITQVLEMHLTQLGYRVAAYNDSVAALTDFASDPNQYDLVISDVTMPAMTGVELARIMHQIRPNLPIVLQSGHIALSQSDAGLEQNLPGIKKILTKPIGVHKYAIEIRSILDKAKETLNHS